MGWLDRTILEGDSVRLEPLEAAHAGALFEAGCHKAIWRWMPASIETLADAEHLVSRALEWPERQWGQSFAIRVVGSGEVVGSTAYLNADERARRVEIGWTWITPGWQRTGVNTEAKLLMLDHAFRSMGANRVEFKTDSMNETSRIAIVRIGAVEEGTLRCHMVRPDGTLRDSVYFSIVAPEWPGVESRLRNMLGAHGQRLPSAT